MNRTAQAGRATSREWIGLGVLALACLLYVMDLTVLRPGHPGDHRRPAPDQRPAAVDHRRVRVHGGRRAGHDGHARRPDRPPAAAADRGRGVRGGVGAGRVLDHAGDADPEPGAARAGRRDDRAVHPVADLPHVPRPPAAHGGRRGLDRRVLRGQRGRAGARRGAAGGVLVGIGVPAGAAGDGRPAGARPAGAARVPRPDGRSARPGQRGDVGAGPARRGLRGQADRPGRALHRGRAGRSPVARCWAGRGCGGSAGWPIP